MSGASSKAREAVLISGMHRSGTAAVSRAISFLGYAQPQLLTEAGPQNPRGYWQPTRIVQINEAMIASLGWSWDHTPLLGRGGRNPEQTEADLYNHMISTWLERAREGVRDSYRSDAARVVCKDPRISLFAPFWQAAFEAEGFEVKHLVAFRAPMDVAASLNRTYGLGQGPALRAWLAYNLRVLSSVKVAATVAYDDLLSRPFETVNTAARALGALELDPAAAAELEEFVDRASPSLDEGSIDSGSVAKLVSQTYDLLLAWRQGADERLDRKARKHHATLVDAQLLFGRVRRLPPMATAPVYEITLPAANEPEAEGARTRPVVLHYHLFKNAGTSVDTVLEANFGDDWREHEFDSKGFEPNTRTVVEWLESNPTVRALSSRSMAGPLPASPGLNASPVIFVRHPLDRIRSAYEFERRQKSQERRGGFSGDLSLGGYVSRRLLRGDRQCSSYQTYCFSAFSGPRLAGGMPDREMEKTAAMDTARSLPFIGVVEDFAASMADLETYLRQDFPDFRAFGAKENVWREDETLGQRLERMRRAVGEDIWRQLEEANQEDMELYRLALDHRGLTLDDVLNR
ncbi:MAG: sulfotransferase family protein [Caulobacteraceae bacterium]